jgi:hypothetical protein
VRLVRLVLGRWLVVHAQNQGWVFFLNFHFGKDDAYVGGTVGY